MCPSEKTDGNDVSALRLAKQQLRCEQTAVDKTLPLRTGELLLRFLKRDMQNIYSYPGCPCERFFSVCENPTRLPVSEPEAEGISSDSVCKMLKAAGGDGEGNVLQLMLLRHGKVICDATWRPYLPATPHQLYSASKSVTATAIGMLVDEGKLDIDERLVDIFADKAPGGDAHPLAGLTVRHLLTMSTGVQFNEVGTALGSDWEREFLSCGAKFEPGSTFEYNSMNTYMLSAVVRRKSGMGLTQYLTPRLFEPLGVGLIDWEKCPEGTEKGGWGLSMTAGDLAKIGQLYLQKGLWYSGGGQKRLLSERWVEQASGLRIETPNAESKHGYGYQIWLLPDGEGYLFNGAFGQYVMIIPRYDAVAVVYSGTSRLFADNGLVEYVLQALKSASDSPLPADPEASARLALTIDALSCKNRPIYGDDPDPELPLERLAEKVGGKAYSLKDNYCSVFPVILQSVHNDYSAGVRRIAFRRLPGALAIKLFEGENANLLTVTQGDYSYCTVELRGEKHLVAVLGRLTQTETGLRLRLRLHYLQTPFTALLTLDFEGEKLHLDCDEYPSLRSAGLMMMQLANLTPQRTLKNLAPLLRRERVSRLLRDYTTTRADGSLLRKAAEKNG